MTIVIIGAGCGRERCGERARASRRRVKRRGPNGRTKGSSLTAEPRWFHVEPSWALRRQHMMAAGAQSAASG